MANRIETSLLVKGLTADTYALDVRGKTFVDGDIEINGNVNIVGTATTINTQTVQARDNKIELNYSGSTSTAIGGGIEILSGRTDGSSVSLTIDTDRDWNSNAGFNITGRTSDATTNGLKVQNSGGTDTLLVRNDGYVRIGTTTGVRAEFDVNANGGNGLYKFMGGNGNWGININPYDSMSNTPIISSVNNGISIGSKLWIEQEPQIITRNADFNWDIYGSTDWNIRYYGTSNKLFTVKNDGNVGIGTSTPTEKLEVSGNLKVNGDLTVTGDTNLQSFTGTSGNVTTNLLVPTIYGSTSSGGTLTLRSTTNANKGFVSFPEAGTNGVKIGGLVGATTTSAIYLNVASPSNTNYSIIKTEGGTLKLNSNQTDAFTDMFQVLRQGGLSVARMTMNPYGMFFAFDAVTFSNPKTFEIRVPANTGQNTGENIYNFYVQGNTKQWNTGTITNQYWNYFSQNTASFVGPSTITNSYGLFVDAAVAGTNATITNNYALGLNGGLAVSGNTILQSISANSLNITGNTRLTSLTGNSLNITGNTIISSFTGGSGTINGNLIVTGNTSMTGTLSVTGNTNVRAFTGTTGYFSGTGQNVLTVIGSGNSTSSPIFSVIGNGTGAELFSVTDSFSGSLFSVNDISGLSILDVNSDSTILMGNYLAPSLNTTTRTSLTAGTTTVYSIPTSAYTGAFFDYTLISTGSTGARAGTIMSIWSGSSAQFTEVSTNDIGVTTGVTFTVAVSGNNAVLSSSATTTGWTLKTIVRSI